MPQGVPAGYPILNVQLRRQLQGQLQLGTLRQPLRRVVHRQLYGVVRPAI